MMNVVMENTVKEESARETAKISMAVSKKYTDSLVKKLQQTVCGEICGIEFTTFDYDRFYFLTGNRGICRNIIDKIKRNGTIILGYPTQFSNAPYMVRDFIKTNASLWKGRKMICVATMGAFSGDGAGCAARLLKKYGAVILGGVHIKMPDSVCDSKLLKRQMEENKKIIEKADRKIYEAAKRIKQGDYPKEGLTIFSHIAGLFGQRLWFYKKTA